MKIINFSFLFALCFIFSSCVFGQTTPTQSPTAACECVALCEQCGGSNTADCQTVCEYAQDPSTCVELCDATLHTGETGATDPVTVTSKGCASQKIGMMSIIAAAIVGVAV